MSTPFTKYTSLDTETLGQYESHDEFESNGPFSGQNEESYASTYEHDHNHETETIDQLDYADSEQVEEVNFSDELTFPENPNPLSEYEIAQEIEHQVAVANSSNKAKPGSDRTNWAKGVLNRILGLNLPDDNALDTATKNAIGDFQSKNNLQPTKNIDGATERALFEADALLRSKGTVSEAATLGCISVAKTKIEDYTKRGATLTTKYILQKFRDPRKIFALVLHHMAMKRWNMKSKKLSDPESYLATGAHFCILLDGKIIQLHPISREIWHSHCTSPGSVGVEFEGNFPNIHNKWYTFTYNGKLIVNEDHPTQAQYESGRFLASYLKSVLGITRILAHAQSSNKDNDPGPDIWYNVGQWSIDKLGLSDGGPKSFCDDGTPIPAVWRTWGDKTKSTGSKEVGEYEDHECKCKKKRRQQAMSTDASSDVTSEYSWENEDDFVQDAEEFNESESDFDNYTETEEFVRDWTEAVKANRYYGEKLGWNKFAEKINDMLLPHSGMSNVSLGEEAFAAAVFQWQTKNGFTGNNIDGVIGPATWTAMRKTLNIPGTSNGTATLPKHSRNELINGLQIRFAQKPNGGWAAYGGGLLRERLFKLKQKLNLTDTEIKIFELVSQPESGKFVGAINSYDNMGMSMGFIQFTLRSNELIELIKRTPATFQKHGIELDPTRTYTWSDGKSTMALKNVPTISDLKSLDLAKRFFAVSLEEDIIVKQIEIGRDHIKSIRKRDDPNGYLNRFNDKHPEMWAFIYEAFNSRPAILHPALKLTIQTAASQGINDHVKFANLLHDNLKTGTANYYGNMSYKNEAAKQAKLKYELEKLERVHGETFLGKK